MQMVYGKSKVSSTVTQYDDSVRISGSGRCSSDSVPVLESMSSGIVSAVDNANENAYRAHRGR